MRSCEDERSGKNSESRKKEGKRTGEVEQCTESAQSRECPAVPGALLIGGG